jgi:hypothetical protein
VVGSGGPFFELAMFGAEHRHFNMLVALAAV